MIKWLKTGVVFKGLINEFFLVFCDFPLILYLERRISASFLSERVSWSGSARRSNRAIII
jgi:hypothetical protein